MCFLAEGSSFIAENAFHSYSTHKLSTEVSSRNTVPLGPVSGFSTTKFYYNSTHYTRSTLPQQPKVVTTESFCIQQRVAYIHSLRSPAATRGVDMCKYLGAWKEVLFRSVFDYYHPSVYRAAASLTNLWTLNTYRLTGTPLCAEVRRTCGDRARKALNGAWKIIYCLTVERNGTERRKRGSEKLTVVSRRLQVCGKLCLCDKKCKNESETTAFPGGRMCETMTPSEPIARYEEFGWK